MHHPTRRDVPACPTGTAGAQAKIYFLEVEEIVVVQQANVLEYGAADDHAGPSHPVAGMGFVLHRGRHHVAMQQARDEAKTETAFQLARQGWEAESRAQRLAVEIL